MTRLAIEKDCVQVGGPTYAGDLAEVILRCLQRIGQGQSPWGTYHFAGQPFVSWARFASSIFEVVAEKTGAPVAEIERILTENYPQPATRPLNSRLDSSKLESVLGLDAFRWERGLERAVDGLLRAGIGSR